MCYIPKQAAPEDNNAMAATEAKADDALDAPDTYAANAQDDPGAEAAAEPKVSSVSGCSCFLTAHNDVFY